MISVQDAPRAPKPAPTQALRSWGAVLQAARANKLVTVTFIVLPFLASYLIRSPATWNLGMVVLAVFGVVALYDVAVGTYDLFLKPQTRLSEWLAASIVIASFAGLGRAVLKTYLPAAGLTFPIGAYIVVTLISTGYGWRAADRLREQDSRARWRILATYWLAALGVCVLVTRFMSPSESSIWGLLAAYVICMILVSPAQALGHKAKVCESTRT